ncbi:MAG TPA: ATP-binding protein [Haliangiales bacterium]|nr:ATP-binding protein [Haliangiales bacterium]
MALTVTLATAANVALAVGMAQLCPPAMAIPCALILAVPLTFLVARLVSGPVRALMRAVGDGLLSLGERDYSIRIAGEREDELGMMVRRFNRLAVQLREERNEIFQKEMVLETVLGAAPLAIVLANEAGRVVYANPTAYELFAGSDKLDGQVFADMIGKLPTPLREALERSEDGLVTFEQGDREEAYGVMRRYFTISTQQHTLYLARRLTHEMAQSEAETWKRAIRIISHELNNSLAPITSLIHSARHILQHPEHAHRLKAVFDTIEERSGHLKNFLEAYARFAKLPRPTPRPVPWRELVDGLAKLYTFKIAGDVPPEPGWFDPAQLEQVCINLLKNAAESGSPTDEIALEINPGDDGTELRVLDRGKGMTEDALRKALLPFYSTKKTGSGLGLALCRDIVAAHGGKLAIAPRDGGGLAVSVWLPRPPDHRYGPPNGP